MKHLQQLAASVKLLLTFYSSPCM